MGPVVGITTAHVEEEINTYPRYYYVRSITEAGGTPLLLPNVPQMIEQYLGMVDAIVLSGGSDVDASHFAQEPIRGTGRVYRERDEFEIALTRRALELGRPLLGICRGIQVLNIAAGGDIYQDIYTQVPGSLEHSQKAERSVPWHSVEFKQQSLIEGIYNFSVLRVNSFHHQAVSKVAPGFSVAAVAKDGVIEAIESNHHRFVIGVQWHPEAMAESKNVFKALINAVDSK